MNNIILLTKVFLKNSMFKNSNSKTEDKKSKRMLAMVGFALIYAYVIGIFGYLSYEMIQSLLTVNQAGLFLGAFLLAVGALILFQSIVSSMNLFYFSKDVENILPLPIKPYQILVAKFNVLVITEYITVLLFAIAPFIIYGVLTGARFIILSLWYFSIINISDFTGFDFFVTGYFTNEFFKDNQKQRKSTISWFFITNCLGYGNTICFFGATRNESRRVSGNVYESKWYDRHDRQLLYNSRTCNKCLNFV